LAQHNLFGHGLAVVLGEGGLVIEQIKLARRAAHEQVNDTFGLGQEMGLLRRQRTGRSIRRARCLVAAEQRRQRNRAQSDAALAEKPAACDEFGPLEAEFVNQTQSRASSLHSFVIVSSRFKMARDTIAHAATLCRFTSGGTFLMSGTATASAAALRSSQCLYCPPWKRRIDLTSRSVGARPVQSRKAYVARLGSSLPPSFHTRKPIACAASTKVFSFKVVSACSGVFERTRRGHELSEVGASNAISDGKGSERFQKVYIPRRKRSSPAFSGQEKPP